MFLYRQRPVKPLDEPHRIGRVSRISIYPVKGCRRVELQSAEVTPSGLAGDREYMIVRETPDENGLHHFVTQRDKRYRTEGTPQSLAIMALIHPETSSGVLRLTWRGSDPVTVNQHEEEGQRQLRVKIHRDIVSAEDMGDDAANWLSEHLDLKVRLVRASGEFRRLASQVYLKNENPVRFQDAYPVHWVMKESLDELSRTAGMTIPWTRFRPNIVAEGGAPSIEHQVNEGEMGEVNFIQPKPCTRCPITTVDQDLGQKKGTEPLKSLATYKRWQKTREPIFGENMLPLRGGKIRIGDEIIQLSSRNPSLVYGSSATN